VDDDEEPFSPDGDSLRRFIEQKVLPSFETRRKELSNRPLIREQAFGESLGPDKLELLARYEVHLDRKLERTLAMLFRRRLTCKARSVPTGIRRCNASDNELGGVDDRKALGIVTALEIFGEGGSGPARVSCGLLRNFSSLPRSSLDEACHTGMGPSKMDVPGHTYGDFTLNVRWKSFHSLENRKHRSFPEQGLEEQRYLARVPRRIPNAAMA
jgi:hypothetical protein